MRLDSVFLFGRLSKREREREREIYIYIYTHIYIEGTSQKIRFEYIEYIHIIRQSDLHKLSLLIWVCIHLYIFHTKVGTSHEAPAACLVLSRVTAQPCTPAPVSDVIQVVRGPRN